MWRSISGEADARSRSNGPPGARCTSANASALMTSSNGIANKMRLTKYILGEGRRSRVEGGRTTKLRGHGEKFRARKSFRQPINGKIYFSGLLPDFQFFKSKFHAIEIRNSRSRSQAKLQLFLPSTLALRLSTNIIERMVVQNVLVNAGNVRVIKIDAGINIKRNDRQFITD